MFYYLKGIINFLKIENGQVEIDNLKTIILIIFKLVINDFLTC